MSSAALHVVDNTLLRAFESYLRSHSFVLYFQSPKLTIRQEALLAPIPSREVRSPIIKECVVHYECRTVNRIDMVPDALVQSVREKFYKNGDFHRVYFGEIVASYADEDATQRLGIQGQGSLTSQP